MGQASRKSKNLNIEESYLEETVKKSNTPWVAEHLAPIYVKEEWTPVHLQTNPTALAQLVWQLEQYYDRA